MFDEKRYFGTQYPSDFSLSGVYPIVIEQTNAVIKNNKVDGNRTIVSNYNSKVIVENLINNLQHYNLYNLNFFLEI